MYEKAICSLGHLHLELLISLTCNSKVQISSSSKTVEESSISHDDSSTCGTLNIHQSLLFHFVLAKSKEKWKFGLWNHYVWRSKSNLIMICTWSPTWEINGWAHTQMNPHQASWPKAAWVLMRWYLSVNNFEFMALGYFLKRVDLMKEWSDKGNMLSTPYSSIFINSHYTETSPWHYRSLQIWEHRYSRDWGHKSSS